MPRIPPIGHVDASSELQLFYDYVEKMCGRVPNFFKTMAHSPGVVRWMLPWMIVLNREGADSVLDVRTKLLAILKTSTLNECEY